MDNTNPTYFGSTFAFLPTHKTNAKNAKELPSQRTKTVNMNGQTATEKEQRRHNIGFAKWRV